MKIILTGRIPSKKNSRINTRSGRSFPSKKFAEWHKKATYELMDQQLIEVEHPVFVDIVIKFPDLRRQDLTNKAESIMDLLVDFGIIPDDNYLIVPYIKIKGVYDKENPGATINIKKWENQCQ